jgi:predicted nuclease of restriction endonuclease-like (RecB) superfamily
VTAKELTETSLIPPDREQQAFAQVVELIRLARERAMASVNTTPIDLNWQVGEFISQRIDTDGWGKGTVTALADHIRRRYPGVRGFSQQNLWRMRQFFESYRDAPEPSSLLRELPWSSNLHILTKPEHIGKLDFYLEALDRDVRKPHERPTIGVLLCASKDAEVVEYALSRSLSPALVAEYQTRLPDKKLLQAKLHEFYALSETEME